MKKFGIEIVKPPNKLDHNYLIHHEMFKKIRFVLFVVKTKK